ncbi:hypothetical protein BC939DRAFT_451752 [Gamsiella multidivaricata]|uniref:uncharacterized protein n=1 Tax=Gamsiella multidivaricata TaxID=101098 RepID=UPI00221F5B0A|nr:uncharacterized protein BC939DRAFT_451752 [Gamsiella multidivaricata]KAG0361662.1 hypothetical protein BGZ54_009023 [Gamsiella multidivaricata]KAI7823341.1 hypothetical protein BC939DRAFT_451752 [Gamsiella multidivaricata]
MPSLKVWIFTALLSVGAVLAQDSSYDPLPLPPRQNAGPPRSAVNRVNETADLMLFQQYPQHDMRDIEEFQQYMADLYKTNNMTLPTSATPSRVKRADNALPLTPFCVAHAYNPHRTRIFYNQRSCDGNGWKTLFVFNAFTQYDRQLASSPSCVGLAQNPERTMIYRGVDNCNRHGWSHVAHFYESGCLGGDPDANCHHHSSEIFQAYDPHRAMIYPYYDGTKHGWSLYSAYGYKSRYRLPQKKELDHLKKSASAHIDLHKRMDNVAPAAGNLALRRAIFHLITYWTNDYTHHGNIPTLRGRDHRAFASWATRIGLSQFLDMTIGQGPSRNGITSVVLRFNGITYAVATLRISARYYADDIIHALTASVERGLPTMAESDLNLLDKVVMYLTGDWGHIHGAIHAFDEL